MLFEDVLGVLIMFMWGGLILGSLFFWETLKLLSIIKGIVKWMLTWRK